MSGTKTTQHVRATSRTVEHIGEWQVALDADTLEALFEEVARVIAGALGTPSEDHQAWEPIVVGARTLATLLVDWANELLGRSEASGRAYREVRNVRIEQRRDGSAQISAEVCGRPVEVWTSPLKAATYHALELVQRDGRWHAMLLFDV